MLVLINVVLFGASLSAENIDQNVSSAILYIMFAIAYYVTTSTCLFGANALKRRACNQSVLAESAANGQHQSLVANKEGKADLTITTPGDNFVPPSSNSKSAVANTKNVSKKQQVSGKRGNDTRKTGVSSSSGISSVHLSNQAVADKKASNANTPVAQLAHLKNR